jgi:hypothetical protein
MQACDEAVEGLRHLRLEGANAPRRGEQDLREDRRPVLGRERRSTRQELEEHAAERERVRACVDGAVAAGLLRRQCSPESRARCQSR